MCCMDNCSISITDGIKLFCLQNLSMTSYKSNHHKPSQKKHLQNDDLHLVWMLRQRTQNFNSWFFAFVTYWSLFLLIYAYLWNMWWVYEHLLMYTRVFETLYQENRSRELYSQMHQLQKYFQVCSTKCYLFSSISQI